MVTQKELSEYAKLKAQEDKVKKERGALRVRLIKAYRDGEAVETGRLILKASINDEATSTAWKPVVDRITELHPELAGGIASIVRENTKISPDEKVDVKATA